MNKRQAKKARKKVVYPLVDEMNLLTLSTKEYEEAMKDFHEWVQKHCRYKHYKDKYKHIRFNCYHFPVGKLYLEHREQLLKTVRCYNVDVKIVSQCLDDIKKAYPTEFEILLSQAQI